ncbi:hypothetical protein BWI17_05500 [Betaproteobacteria bacterium GR16-43]|nr:hypothetical protein BWI17_05500 [Betaproteobacteria bacterium GR16-43]
MSEPKYDPKTRDLAEKIYRDLVTKAADVSAKNVGMNSDPANLAAISFKLSAAFMAVEVQLNAANLPKNQDFQMNVDHIASWNK